MKESKLLVETEDLLLSKYDHDQVVIEADLGGTFRPDIVVFEGTSRDQPFLIVELSSLRTPHRQEEDIEQVKEMMNATNASYGAVVSKGVQYVFEMQEDARAEVSLGDFPLSTSTRPETRGVRSAREFEFLLNRLRDYRVGISEFEFIQYLHYEYEASRLSLSFEDIRTRDDIVSQLADSIASQHTSFDKDPNLIDEEILEKVFAIFAGYNLTETKQETAEAIIEWILELDLSELSPHSTPKPVARELTRLAGVGKQETVLDPASGIGNISRIASSEGGNVHSVEIVANINNIALFFDDLLGVSVSRFNDDFLQMFLEADNRLPDSPKHILLNPPVGRFEESVASGSYDKLKDLLPLSGSLRSEVVFLRASLDLLPSDGKITAVVPSSFLTSYLASDFREQLIEEFSIECIIELRSSDLFPGVVSGFNFSIIQIAKERESPSTQFAIVEGDDQEMSRYELQNAVTRVLEGDAQTLTFSNPGKTLLPSEEIQTTQIKEQLKNKYGEVAPLSEVSDEIRTGVPTQHLTQDKDGVPYLRLGSRGGDICAKVDEKTPIAEETDLLLGVMIPSGGEVKIKIPDEAVVPAQHWAVIRFGSHDAAKVYGAFFKFGLGGEQIDAITSGNPVAHLPLHRLKEIQVPVWDPEQISEIARRIQQRKQELSEAEREKETAQNRLSEVFDE
ncbi:N-6 DNA methylase [Natrialbaceae archaeon A-CW3]